MLASETLRKRASAAGHAAVVVLATAIGWCGIHSNALGGERASDFDPFETAVEVLAEASNVPSQARKPGVRKTEVQETEAPGGSNPFAVSVSDLRIIQLPAEEAEHGEVTLSAEVASQYDPFDQPMLETSDVTPVANLQELSDGPAFDELLPAPDQNLNENEDPRDISCDWTPTPLEQLTVNIHLPAGRLPRDCSAEQPPEGLAYYDPCGPTRGWPMVGYQWKASGFCHNPLYFEEINLERYGYGCGCYGCGCLQYGVSAAHFFGTVPALPYLMATDCPWECDYTLGHYRPGSCPPWRFHWPTCCSRRGTATEIGVITGLIFLIP